MPPPSSAKKRERKKPMPDIKVLISTVADGSMYNRHDIRSAAIIKNRERFLKKHGITMQQTTCFPANYSSDDFCRYRTVSRKDGGIGMTGDSPIIADALATRDSGHALMLPVADCIGTALYDPTQRVLMVAHLGRHSLEQQGGTKVVEYLQTEFNCNPADVQVWLTPAPGKDAYPIWALDNKGMKEAAFEQLQAGGILLNNIHDNPADTTKDENYFSYSEFLKGNRDHDGDYAIVAMMTK